ncbi:hypothetical protein GW796_08515 [archaeon]|nr:hypothetical protein [archaeon]
MNTDELTLFIDLTQAQQQTISVWTMDINTHVIVYPKKLFWVFYKNIPIIDENRNILIFTKFSDALNKIKELKNQ